MDESKAMKDLNSRIKQLTKLILTSQTVDEASRPGSPVKIDFDMSSYQVRSILKKKKASLAFKLWATEDDTSLFSSSNKNSFPLVARSNLKLSSSSPSKTRSAIDPSSRPMRQRARRIN